MSESIYVPPFPEDWVQRWVVYSLASYNRATGVLDTTCNIVLVHMPPVDNPNDDPGFTLQIRDMLLGFAHQAYSPDQGWVGHATTYALVNDPAFLQWAKERGA